MHDEHQEQRTSLYLVRRAEALLGALQFFRKQTFFLEAIAELLEGDPQRAGADGIEGVDNELVFTAWCVDGELAARANFQTVGGTETNARVG